ncbi:mitochondrial import inner membrane translocase subunit Tim21-like [Panonychus citri]|uniref:mitochondrial import inner membrane translocase subunit Tim21-like n=1 Tax=Panonychus citri TaxID=50023 RepID=UPI002307CC03|nr:mitochondrial import inner membrane translocase subunit Tim21-like [Panonychus citri]
MNKRIRGQKVVIEMNPDYRRIFGEVVFIYQNLRVFLVIDFLKVEINQFFLKNRSDRSIFGSDQLLSLIHHELPEVLSNNLNGFRCRLISLNNHNQLLCTFNYQCLVKCHQSNQSTDNKDRKSITPKGDDDGETKVSVSVGEKVVHGTKLVFYLSFFAGGLALIGVIGYTVFNELFSSSSPSNIQSKAFDLIKEDNRVIDILGKEMKAFGSATWGRRGRHQPAYQTSQTSEGTIKMNMVFKLSGPRGRATAYVEIDDYGKGNYITGIVVQSDLGVRQIIKVL